METNYTQQITDSLPELHQVLQSEADEQAAAVDVIEAALRLIAPGETAILRYLRRRNEDWLLGGPGERHHRRDNYATTGQVSGWGYVLTANGLIYRRYSGAHSDFPDYQHIEKSDSVVSVAAMVSGMLDAYPQWTATDIACRVLEALSQASTGAAAEKRSVAAQKRTEKLQSALAALAR